MAKKREYIGKSVGLVERRQMELPLPEEGFVLEHGGILRSLTVAYEMCGNVREEKDNVVFICHALTGDAHVAGSSSADGEPDGWWEGMVGSGRGIDTDKYCVVCANILGGCRGTTGPSSIDPDTGEPYGSRFPEITIRDIVRVHLMLLERLGIKKVFAAVGGSFGGMQVLDWATEAPDTLENAIVIASAPSLSAQALAFDIIGRRAITHDPSWQHGDYYRRDQAPDTGLGQARRLAHITYLSDELMNVKFGRDKRPELEARGKEFLENARRDFRTTFQIESYLDHQAAKFVQRFDANSYLHITRAMDEFDLVERHSSLRQAFSRIKCKVLIASLSGDWLFNPEQSELMAKTLLNLGKSVSYFNLEAPAGHDAFLTHIDQLLPVVRSFLANGRPREIPPDELEPAKEKAYAAVTGMVEPGSRILDIGCARGRLMRILREKRNARCVGIDIDFSPVLEALGRGNDVILDDMRSGSGSSDAENFFMVPDDSFDTVILSETIQVMKRPLKVLKEALRIAKSVIVTFPNFGYVTTRSQLFFFGHMPVDEHLPLEWYNTPNIHLFTLRDFLNLCRDNGIIVREVVPLSESRLGRFLMRTAGPNIGAEHVAVKIERAGVGVGVGVGEGEGEGQGEGRGEGEGVGVGRGEGEEIGQGQDEGQGKGGGQ